MTIFTTNGGNFDILWCDAVRFFYCNMFILGTLLESERASKRVCQFKIITRTTEHAHFDQMGKY